MSNLKFLFCFVATCVMSSLSCDRPQGYAGSEDLNDGTSGCPSMFVSLQRERGLMRPEMLLASLVADEEMECRGSLSGMQRLLRPSRAYKICRWSAFGLGEEQSMLVMSA